MCFLDQDFILVTVDLFNRLFCENFVPKLVYSFCFFICELLNSFSRPKKLFLIFFDVKLHDEFRFSVEFNDNFRYSLFVFVKKFFCIYFKINNLHFDFTTKFHFIFLVS